MPTTVRDRLKQLYPFINDRSPLFILVVCLIFGIVGVYFLVTSQAASNWKPVYSANFADPWVLSYGGKYYGFATESGANISSAVSSDEMHWTKSSDALPRLPSWAAGGQNWAPTVAYNPSTNKFVMFYAVLDNKLSPRRHCISMATSSSPAGPYVDSSSGPFLCQTSLGGSNDPDLFYDSNGKAYLYVKNAGDAGGVADSLWVQPLTSSMAPTGPLTKLLTQDQSWQGRTIEGPGMVKLGDKYFLFYAGNAWNTSRYAIGYAICNSPLGPCTEGPHNPVIATTGAMLGPGSPAFYVDGSGAQRMVFHAYTGSVGGARNLYEAAVTLNNGQPVLTPATTSPNPVPQISITVPKDGATVGGSAVAVSAIAQIAGDTISSITLKAGGTTLATCNGATCNATWNTTTLSDGTYPIVATAIASGGGTAQASENVTIHNQTSTNITAPSAISSPSQTASSITLKWNASNDTNYASSQLAYQVFRDGVQVADTGQGTTTYTDTGLNAGASYTYTITASDPAGLTSISSSPFTESTQSTIGGNGLSATYYPGLNFQGIGQTAIDPNINFNWGLSGPFNLTNNFSVRWVGAITAPTTGDYTFTTRSDDGVRLWVADKNLINHWSDHATATDSGTIHLVGGQSVPIRLDYYEHLGHATIALEWAGPGFARQIVPQPVLSPSTNPGLFGEYFDGTNNSRLVMARQDSSIAFNWGSGSPDPLVPTNHWAVRWVGKIQVPTAGSYTFTTHSDDGVRVWINGKELINHWSDHGIAKGVDSAQITLNAGQKYDIQVNYYEDRGVSQIGLYWNGPSLTFAPIPGSALTDN